MWRSYLTRLEGLDGLFHLGYSSGDIADGGLARPAYHVLHRRIRTRKPTAYALITGQLLVAADLSAVAYGAGPLDVAARLGPRPGCHSGKNGGVPRLLTAESVGAYLLDVLDDLRRLVVSEAENGW